MGDSGEGLVDAEARIQERIEELQRSREQARKPKVSNPEQARKIESLKLARTELSRRLDATTHPGRKTQISNSISEIDRQIGELGEGRKGT
jgi:hypothetical protein